MDTPPPPLLTVSRLTITFAGGPAVVDGLSFTLAAGERLGLLGLSGSGKSMTALAILGLLPAGATVSGSIRYQPAEGPAVELTRLSEKEWRALRGRALSLVFQEPLTALNPVQRVGQQLLEGARSLCPELRDEAQRKAHVRHWLERVELAGIADRIYTAYPHELSGGQRQRVLIALALLGKPRLLIADEPTTALDTLTEDGILELLARLRRDLGLATLFITHDLRVMARSADTILVLDAGKEVSRVDRATLTERGTAVFASATQIKAAAPAVAPAPAVYAAPRPPALSVADLSVDFSEKSRWPWRRAGVVRAVRAVSFSVRPGEWVAIVGPSGCGKTTVARCLAGLLPVASGQVQLAPGGSVQLVFQDPFGSLNPRHTVATAITEVLRAVNPGQSRYDRTYESVRLQNMVGLPADTFADRHAHQLSGGQRQRVAIARALAARPSVLVADEAVSALDAPLRLEILDLLDKLRREHDLALLFISHDLTLVADRADRVLVMDAGRIVEEGPAGQVLRYPVSDMAKRLVASSRKS